MGILFKLFLTLHIIGGAIGLFTGTMNMIGKKGNKKHKLIGKIFSYSMLIAGFSALVLCLIHPNQLLFIIAVFTIYLVSTGNRYIYLKMLGSNQRPALLDWVITLSMLFAGIAFYILGILLLLKPNNFGIVYLVFGTIGLNSVKTDYMNYTGRVKNKNYWLLTHLQRMTGGYISAVTAFLVVNANYIPVDIPNLAVWLLPTAILTPMIILWSKKYRAK